ncbi:orotate phosphoribosyltransferase [Acidaminobacter sp.]|uniref:orotate phosphoribosyltransferase n=1 Tax=Acidaminobacter sp. TaxID=1872102 RepID=UPI0013861DC6|nr:orotate phosphoribosyltransferase [Acidaminobacter sp.]MDK9710480.1 orotate phosphoribosyltransferase [Acidaminobacter sp.]MZQ96135.1 orotate phosphoribosyltransferase [Acidaminobacter sp.]
MDIKSGKDYAEMLLSIGAVSIRGEDALFTWASGIKSPIYCDNRLVIGYPDIRKSIARGIAQKMTADFGADFDLVAATATAGIPHGAWVSDILEKPMVYVRSSQKEHGKGNQIEGPYKAGQRVLLVEDLLSTGGSSLKCVEALEAEGLEVLKIYGIFNYGFESMKLRLAERNMPYETLTDYPTLLELLRDQGKLTREEAERLALFSDNPRIFTED